MARRSPPWPSTGAFLTIFALALAVSPTKALAQLWTRLTGKRVRAWHRLGRLAVSHPCFYQRWRARFLPGIIRRWIGPQAGVVGMALLPPTAGGTLADWLGSAGTADWLVPMLPGDQVAPELAEVIAAAAARNDDARIIYWDEDVATSAGLSRPWLKPDWDPLLHMARDCLSGAAALNRDSALATLSRLPPIPADAAGLAELLAAMIGDGVVPVHVPLVLTTRGEAPIVPAHWPALLGRHSPNWVIRGQDHGFVHLSPPDPQHWPSVSIIIPTRDRADLLEVCLGGVARLAYPGAVEIIVVDNGSREPGALALMADAAARGQVRLLRDDAPFNYSRLNNRAAALAQGDYLCLLNNDVEAQDGDWLGHLVRHAVQPSIGAVGARLLYPDGTIQHAGVAMGVGDAAGHIQRGEDPASPAHASWHAVSRRVSAVTGACLLVSAADYRLVGGLDEAGFAVAFNDVDLCLRLRAAGRHNVYCAEAMLVHAESRTRPSDNRPDQRARFQRELALLQTRWRTAAGGDPHHSPLFDRASEQCLLALA